MQAPVSVIIPCYRCADTIGRAVESVIRQTLPPKEILLVEDCSDNEDMTLASLYRLQQDFQDEINIKVIQLKSNSGPGAARNAGWNEVQQPFIAFLDADDCWHPRKLEIQYQWMESHPEVAMTGHLSQVLARDQVLPGLPDDTKASLVTPRKILLRNMFPTRTVMIRREVPLRFDAGMRRSEDYHLWLRIVLQDFQAWRLELPLAYSFKEDFGVGGLSAALWKMEQAELHTFSKIHQIGLISFPVFWVLCGWSLIKYLRRLVLSRIALG